MRKAGDRQRQFSRRAFLLGGLQLGALTALGSRLYYLQFQKKDEYQTLSENNRIKLQLLAPSRGKILDRLGDPLAGNEQNYQLLLDATGMRRKQIGEIVARVGGIVTIPDRQRRQVEEQIRVNPYAFPLLLKDHLAWEEVAAIELQQLQLSGVYIDIGQVRAYPYAEHSAHLLGYVGAVSPEEVESGADQPLLRLPEFRIGKSGVEKMLESRLRGTAGIKQVEVNVHGQPVRDLETRPSVPGENVRLTIDSRLQEYASQLLGEESGSVILLEVDTGNVLALTSMPGFDPNIFSKGIPQEYWTALHANERDPLVNKSIQGQFPPGSTFKMLVGLAGLRAEAIGRQTRVHCPGYFFLGNHRFNCWKEGGHGNVGIKEALMGSCDTFFYTVAQRTGIDAIAEVARMFGLGDAKLLGLPSEKPGLVPDPEWKQKRYKQRWQAGDTINAGIGQGYVLATPLQLAVMTARLATGKAVAPRLTGGDTPADFPPLDLAADYLELIHEGMDAVANTPGGTAYGKRIAEPRFAMAGKTGTSQVRHIEKRGMKQELLPWEFRHHALFVGYAPVSAPKYACAVLVEHGGGGAAAAAPIARDMLLKVQQLAEEDAKENKADSS